MKNSFLDSLVTELKTAVSISSMAKISPAPLARYIDNSNKKAPLNKFTHICEIKFNNLEEAIRIHEDDYEDLMPLANIIIERILLCLKINNHTFHITDTGSFFIATNKNNAIQLESLSLALSEEINKEICSALNLPKPLISKINLTFLSPEGNIQRQNLRALKSTRHRGIEGFISDIRKRIEEDNILNDDNGLDLEDDLDEEANLGTPGGEDSDDFDIEFSHKEMAALTTTGYQYSPIWNYKSKYIVGSHVKANITAGEEFKKAWGHYNEEWRLQKAVSYMELAIARKFLGQFKHFTENSGQSICVLPIHYSSLDNTALLVPMLMLLDALPHISREKLVIEVMGIPKDFETHRVNMQIASLRKYCRTLLVSFPNETHAKELSQIIELTISAIGCRIKNQDKESPILTKFIDDLSNKTLIKDMGSFLWSIENPAIVGMAIASQIAYISGPAIGEKSHNIHELKSFDKGAEYLKAYQKTRKKKLSEREKILREHSTKSNKTPKTSHITETDASMADIDDMLSEL